MKHNGHYCKICGEYKANEKFSGKGHAVHICKACQALPLEKRNIEATLTRLMNLPYRLSKEQIAWLKTKCKDKRPEISSTAMEIFAERFPNAEKNAKKRQLHISRMSFYVNDTLIDEYGDSFDFCGTFTIDKKQSTITLEADGETKSVTVEMNAMNKLLKEFIHYYEVFTWDEYNKEYSYSDFLDPDLLEFDISDYDETFDEYDTETDTSEEEPAVWEVHIEYTDGKTQDIRSMVGIPLNVEELAEELLEYFAPDEEDEFEDELNEDDG